MDMYNGMCRGNYIDYESDELAREGERRLITGLMGKFVDPDFPSDARAVYFDPYSTPKGQIPAHQLKWLRISDNLIRDCNEPVTIVGNAFSTNIECGILGDKYFVNALRLIGSRTTLVKRLVVSDNLASKGIYTVKFFKLGKWRYVHVDDYIACRPSGKVHFCKNKNANETFAMIIEKAYAKLHGCYEAIAFGLTEYALKDFTFGGHIDCNRNEVNRKLLGITASNDKVWNAITQAKEGLWDPVTGQLASEVDETDVIGCMRSIPDSFTEPPNVRRGIALGMMYEVVDACIAYAAPTETMDALTVGMVLVRNLAISTGRFTGRWSFGDVLWKQYPEIANNLRDRTIKYLVQRGDIKRIKVKVKKAIDPKAKKKPPKQKPKKKNSMFEVPDYEKNLKEGGSLGSQDSEATGAGSTDGGGGGVVSTNVDSAGGINDTSKPESKGDDDDDDWEVVDGISDPYCDELMAQLADGNRIDINLINSDIIESSALEEIDDPKSVFPIDMPSIKDLQPISKDLFWIQIEDFVDIFNRVYIFNDFSLDYNSDCKIKNYESKWIPGDFSQGSGGPPAQASIFDADASSTISFEMLGEQQEENDLFLLKNGFDLETGEDEEEEVDDEDEVNPQNSFLEGEDSAVQTAGASIENNADTGLEGASSLIDVKDGPVLNQDDNGNALMATLESAATDGSEQAVKKPSDNMKNFGEDSTYVGSMKEYSIYDLLASGNQKKISTGDSAFQRNHFSLSSSFVENPMIPFELLTDSRIIITLYQKDLRWSLDRFFDPVSKRTREPPANRHETLLKCLQYEVGIGFVIVKLHKNNSRISTWRTDKMVGKSIGTMFMPSISGCFDLNAGRYALIPYQHAVKSEVMDYLLSFHYVGSESGVKFHFVNDIIAESAQRDDIQSDSDNEEAATNKDDNQKRGLDLEHSSIATQSLLNNPNNDEYDKLPPMPLSIAEWEFNVTVEEIGVKSMFEEVGCLAYTMNNIHWELAQFKSFLQKKKMELQDLKDAEARKQAIAEAKLLKKGKRLGK